ncbi:hypothetical protein AID78_004609 [Salmonella enterica subsp. enterica serovar Java]|nr:hypothetical protein [Salmonella enterica subsp. enterica serovar Java]
MCQMLSYQVWNAQVNRYLYKSGSRMLNGYVRINNIFDREYWFRCIDTSPW